MPSASVVRAEFDMKCRGATSRIDVVKEKIAADSRRGANASSNGSHYAPMDSEKVFTALQPRKIEAPEIVLPANLLK